jgi:hypothetical protein
MVCHSTASDLYGQPQTTFRFAPHSDDEAIFHLPVSKAWLRQLILGLTLICLSSIRGVEELLRDVFDYPISVGTVHAILVDAVEQARSYNNRLLLPAELGGPTRPTTGLRGATGPGLAALALQFQLPVATLREAFNIEAMAQDCSARWPREATLRERLGNRFFVVSTAVAELVSRTTRASSVIENFNGRLRGYFFLRRHLGPDYLALLLFFLNHRRFLRSERPERVGKSLAELLTGKAHPHWLEMLGYARFSRN